MRPKTVRLRIISRPKAALKQAQEADHKVRYRMKPAHAVSVKDRARKAYRQSQKAEGKEFELPGATVLRSLAFLDDYAEKLAVHNKLTNKTASMQVVRLTVLAKLLDTSYQTIWRWTSDTEQLPEPVLTARLDRDRPVYHVEEVRAMVRVIGEHLNQFKYYRKDHTGTRDRIFHAIELLRNTNFGDTTNGTESKTVRKNPARKALGKAKRA